MASEHERLLPFLTRVTSGVEPKIIPLAGDASNRRYYRVVANEHSYVLMQWEPFEDNSRYPFLSVQRHFEKNGVLVPKVIAKSPGEGLVLLEDLGDLTLERKFWENQNQELVFPLYQKAIDEIIKIHYLASRDKSECTAHGLAFDTEKFLWEMNYGKTHLLQQLCGIELSDVENQELTRVFTSICKTLDEEPKYISHRDYHSRNVMIKYDEARVIDFQDARLGPIQYDLVSLVKDSYVDIEPTMALEIIEYYLERRSEFEKGGFSREKFERIYEIQSIQRCFKACGSFASFYNMRKDTRYIKYIRPTLQRVRRSVAQFKEYEALNMILEHRGVFEREFD